MKRVAPFLVLLSAACVQTNVASLNPTVQHFPTCVAAVQLFTSPERVTREYTEIALLNSTGSSSSTNERQMIESMREKAAQAGAHGIILSNIAEPSAGAKVAGAILGTGAERKGRSVAIRIEADSARVREACTRTFVEAGGAAWTVTEFQDGGSSALRFDDGAGTVLYHDDPPDEWKGMEPSAMTRLRRDARPRKAK